MAIFYYRPISIQHQRHIHQYSPAHIMMHANSTTTCSSASMAQPTLFNSVTSRLLSPRRTVSIKPLPLLPLSPPSSPPYKSPAIKSKIKAARTESTGVSLGFRAPHFELQEPLTGKVWTLDEFESYPALLVMFICNHCPFVIHLKKDIVKLANFYMSKGLAIVAISSNSTITHPQDGPEYMAEEAKLLKYPFPYLYDESQEVAKAFGAVCTPEFFLFKKDGRRPFELFYHGQFDDSRPSSNTRVTGRDLSLAIDLVLSGQEPPQIQKPSVGCSIKWHP